MKLKRLLVLLLTIALCAGTLASCTPATPPVGDSGDSGAGNGENENGNEEDTYLMGVLQELLDFTVKVEEGRDPVVLQITDTQIIDASQQRYATRLGDTLYNYWLPENKDERCYDYLRELFTTLKPDLILLTGDVVYGEFDDNGSALLDFIAFMESFNIPWAPVFGNHDNESNMGVAWQCEQLENAKNCLFKRGSVTGNGNYTVGLVQGEKLLRTFVMMDSNGCSNASAKSMSDGQTQKAVGFAEDQIKWFKDVLKDVRFNFPDTKITFAFHIQPVAFSEARGEKGYEIPTDLDHSALGEEGDFGYIGRGTKNPWGEELFAVLKAQGADSILFGHEHCNSASIVYEGIRLQYGQKSSTYDRANYVDDYGEIVGAYFSEETPLVGGTVMVIDGETGAIKDAYIKLCTGAGGDIDWDNFKPRPNDPDSPADGASVAGMDLTALNKQQALTLSTVMLDGKTAYKITASAQGKLHLPVSMIGGDKTLFLTVYVPQGSDTLSGLGEFAIRYKCTAGEGYINFEVSGNHGAFKPIAGTWSTFSIPLASYEGATEFSLIVPAGNTLYLTEVTIE